MTTTRTQHDHHLIPWLKAEFNLTVKDNELAYNSADWWAAFKGDYDLDCKCVTGGPSIFAAALEYAVCYDDELCDKLTTIELGS